MQSDTGIFIGLGANLDHPVHGSPLQTCEKALDALTASGVRVLARSPWYKSQPVPVSDQPWFINGVARVETALDAAGLLALLHAVEERFGRVRAELPLGEKGFVDSGLPLPSARPARYSQWGNIPALALALAALAFAWGAGLRNGN